MSLDGSADRTQLERPTNDQRSEMCDVRYLPDGRFITYLPDLLYKNKITSVIACILGETGVLEELLWTVHGKFYLMHI